MTYKEIINRIRTVAQQHLMIKDFGYGELSDIKTQSQFGPGGNVDDGKEADYPYMFLLQSTATRNDPVMNYNFSMIMMDMARGEEGDKYDNYLTIQSQCQQYIDDVLAQLYYGYRDQPEVTLTGITYTPFKEYYQDEVAGMTANFSIQVPNGLNQCVAPFGDLTEWWSENTQMIGGGEGNVDGAGNIAPFQPTASYLIAQTPQFTDVVSNWNPLATGGEFIAAKTYSKIELTFDMTYTWDPVPYNPDPADPQMNPQWFWYPPFPVVAPAPYSPSFDSGGIGIFQGTLQSEPDAVTGWPDPYVTTPVVGTTYPVTVTWNNAQVSAGTKLRNEDTMTYYPNPAYPPGNPTLTPNLWQVAQFRMDNLNIKLFS
tara:strand:- start:780 stop:1889 length:1110 start_codon:yes stop_codon:yes gene_type:complete